MSDSLSLLAYQAGLVTTPSSEQAAEAANDLCVEQRLMRVGDPLPIVFCRREGNVGGCLVSPGATEAGFSNSATNVLTASWHLVLGEGPMDPIQVRDVFQCACRVGTSTSAFGRRAGSWSPGNATVDRGGTYTRWELPRFCGAAGTFDDLTTLSFVNTFNDGEEWNRQVHVFSRGGRHVTRLLDGVTGPSSNVVDLYLYLLRTVERVPESMIDMESLKHAARFTNLLGMRWDGVLGGEQTENLDDWCENVLKPFFLLARTRRYGMEGLMPLLPTNSDGSLYLGPVGPHATLTETELDLETWSLQFLSLADRRPICAQIQWRQQGDGVDSIVRTSEVRFAAPFNAPDGPFEQHDLSWFATNETHAVKVGAYVVAHRAMATHTLEVSARPGTHNTTLGDGSVVRVRVPRVVDGDELAVHDYLYRVNSVGKDLTGETKYSLIHMPIDEKGRSAVAVSVYRATPSGVLLPITRTGPVCDTNSSSNTDPLAEDVLDWEEFDDEYDVELPLDDMPLDDPLDSLEEEPLPELDLEDLGDLEDPFDSGDPFDPEDIEFLPPLGLGMGPIPMPPAGQPPALPEPPAPEQPLGDPAGGGLPEAPSNPDLPNTPSTTLPGAQAPGDPTAPPEPGYPPEGPEGAGGPQWGPPGAPKVGVRYDIYFEQMMDTYYTTVLGPDGKPLLNAFGQPSYPAGVDKGTWGSYTMQGVSSWYHVQEGWTRYSATGFINPPTIEGVMGISAIKPPDVPGTPSQTLNSTGQGFNGESRSADGNSRMLVWFHQIRNFKIRIHGSGQEFQASPPPKPHKY
jgi:hypothetical protein